MNGMNGENGQNAEEIKFHHVGVTSTTSTGGVGIGALNNACDATFPGSRMCTTVEIMETTPFPAGVQRGAWVRPLIIGLDSQRQLLDASGFHEFPTIVGEGLSCRGWQSSSAQHGGMEVVGSTGLFTATSCSDSRPAACCAPVEPIP